MAGNQERPVIAVDPGDTCGVSLFLPYNSGSIIRYRLSLFGILEPTSPKNVKELFLQLICKCRERAPCLYLEDQYIDRPKEGRLVLRGEKLKALIRNAHCWQFMAEITDVSVVLVNTASWQSSVLNMGGKGVKREVRKRMAQRHVMGIFGIKPTQDEADSICIGIHSMAHETRLAGRICRIDPEGAPLKGKKWRDSRGSGMIFGK